MERAIAPMGAKKVAAGGYVLVKVPQDHPLAPPSTKACGAWIGEHRLVMSEVLGRPLRSGEIVHHLNNQRTDNRPENLELWRRPAHPNGSRANEYHCPGCRCREDT